ncbi:thermonuclease family protein [uncultured Enterococcus sp.]|uniref:thermonuclease family protein n=1 Tax=uncultured Enterococcus sp. TaxID=167972 RepID=UPI002AA81832|nr:thermonuclease family protein [uncultured Enterococcus sp.]
MKIFKVLFLLSAVCLLTSCGVESEIQPGKEEISESTIPTDINSFTGDDYATLPKEQLIPVRFKSHIDGDTTRFFINDYDVKVRYLLIDTPETVKKGIDPHPYGLEASDRTKQLLTEAQKIEIMLDQGDPSDDYGRLLAYIFVDDQLIQEILVREGLARIAYVNVPSVKYLQQLMTSQKQAEDAGIGIWSLAGNDD